MAEIPVERKSNHTWLWLLLALLLIGLLIWWLASGDDESEAEQIAVAEETTATQAATPAGALAGAGAAAAGGMTVASILQSPGTYVGRDDFAAEVDVPEVPTDRGFWVEQDGQRMFALIIDGPREEPMDINSGQRLRITNGMIRNEESLGDVPGEPLDQDTIDIIREQQAFLVVDEDDMEILSRP